jgi:hypothetical protein
MAIGAVPQGRIKPALIAREQLVGYAAEKVRDVCFACPEL